MKAQLLGWFVQLIGNFGLYAYCYSKFNCREKETDLDTKTVASCCTDNISN